MKRSGLRKETYSPLRFRRKVCFWFVFILLFYLETGRIMFFRKPEGGDRCGSELCIGGSKLIWIGWFLTGLFPPIQVTWLHWNCSGTAPASGTGWPVLKEPSESSSNSNWIEIKSIRNFYSWVTSRSCPETAPTSGMCLRISHNRQRIYKKNDVKTINKLNFMSIR